MRKKITIYVTLLFVVLAKTLVNAQNFNSFTSRNFMKMNGFLTVPTFSILGEDKTTATAIVRNSNVAFEDNPRLYLGTYSGKMREQVGAGIAIYQREVGVFKDFGAVANYAQGLRFSDKGNITIGFNFLYTRRSADGVKVNSEKEDPLVANFQDIPIINFQPALTLSMGKIAIGVFFEDLLDYNLKKNEMATSFSDKTYSAHVLYTYDFEGKKGLFEGASVRTLGVARKSIDGFGFAGNLLLDLPKIGWLRGGYDKDNGISAGLGVNLSDRLSIGFTYEKGNIAATNEVGLTYTFTKTRSSSRRVKRRVSGNIEITLPKNTSPIKKEPIYENPEHYDLSDEILRTQDSIAILNEKVEEILKLLKNQPKQVEVIREIKSVPVVVKNEEKDTSLKRRNNTPWREKMVTRGGGNGGTMYYIAVDQFRSKENAEALVDRSKRFKIEAKLVQDPKTELYYVYIDKFAKKEDAEEKVEEFNDKTRMHENDSSDDLAIQIKKTYKDPVYVVEITFEDSESGSYKEPKKQGPAKVRRMKREGDMEEGYYLVVNVFSKKPYADKFIDELRSDNIDADYFINPITGYRHAYIFKTNDRSEVIRLYKNNLNNSYYDTKSIIYVK
ncbi:PorP/SprF family type IX secretion system membrane protein [Tenacibaculum maritimum]|uniref:PorP/SprF family type IX secretion system membrane protein n=1 Tax=Tenacibaculum maritimum TaxID=107401 RepID=UPI0012E670AD|nr:PorP/SprF family type IX secretion system membrane protein [Tenacibaculum maritimum]CAA0243084.1 Putative cell surface protein precursor SprD [Tenacibaculum maritimum]